MRPPVGRSDPVFRLTLDNRVLTRPRRRCVGQIDMICAAAPYVMAMTRRLRREPDFRGEPANIFQFPCWSTAWIGVMHRRRGFLLT